MQPLLSSLQLITVALAGQSAAATLPEWSKVFRRAPFQVKTYASLGESFASGPSAGDRYDGVTKCRRYTQAFGPQTSRDDRIHGPKPMKFDFIACSGSQLKNIYEDRTNSNSGGGGQRPKKAQASQLQGQNPDLVTLSIGGNDVGFVPLLDRCVYRFQDPTCKGCTPSFTFDDCTNDCQKTIDEVGAKIRSPEFGNGLRAAIKAIFDNAPWTHLFITGYPAFWNAETDACDRISFKFACIENSVLPLIKDRRRKMNALTEQLNQRIQSVIHGLGDGRSITYVETNPFFDGHRFCEPGVKEPSYRNPNIWFYPFEYWTGGTLNFDGNSVPSGNCTEMYLNGGDEGDVYGCDLANAVLGGATVDLSNQPNNVKGGDDVAITSSGSIPDFLARVFHPTIKGMGGYKDAIVSAYSAYHAARPTATPPSSSTSTPTPTTTTQPPPPPPPPYVPGSCSFHLVETETCDDDSSNLYATVKLLDNDKNVIGQTPNINNGLGQPINAEDALQMTSKLPLTILVEGEHTGDYIQFAYGATKWRSDTDSGDAKCTVGGWASVASDGCIGDDSQTLQPVQIRNMDCSFPCPPP